MTASGPALDTDASFTLDADLLADKRAANARRVNTVQIPTVRALGFAILCAIAVLQEVRLGVPLAQPQLALLLATNVFYAVSSWLVLRSWYGRTGRIDLGLVFLHLDVLVWLVNLRHFEHVHLFFACLLLVRVADQVGYGFRRAIYFNHVAKAEVRIEHALRRLDLRVVTNIREQRDVGARHDLVIAVGHVRAGDRIERTADQLQGHRRLDERADPTPPIATPLRHVIDQAS